VQRKRNGRGKEKKGTGFQVLGGLAQVGRPVVDGKGRSPGDKGPLAGPPKRGMRGLEKAFPGYGNGGGVVRRGRSTGMAGGRKKKKRKRKGGFARKEKRNGVAVEMPRSRVKQGVWPPSGRPQQETLTVFGRVKKQSKPRQRKREKTRWKTEGAPGKQKKREGWRFSRGGVAFHD